MAIRAVIFDVDDTLVPEWDAWRAAFRVACSELVTTHGCDVDALYGHFIAAARTMWRGSPQIDWCLAVGIGLPSLFLSDYPGEAAEFAFLRAWAPRASRLTWLQALSDAGLGEDHDVDALGLAFKRRFRTNHVAFRDSESALQALDGLSLAAMTNGASDIQREKLTVSGLDRYFEHIFISGEHGIGKPDARIFQMALEALGVMPGEAVMVGDSPARDIGGANNAGMHAVWLDRQGAAEAPTTPHHRIESLSELPGLLETLA